MYGVFYFLRFDDPEIQTVCWDGLRYSSACRTKSDILYNVWQ